MDRFEERLLGHDRRRDLLARRLGEVVASDEVERVRHRHAKPTVFEKRERQRAELRRLLGAQEIQRARLGHDRVRRAERRNAELLRERRDDVVDADELLGDENVSEPASRGALEGDRALQRRRIELAAADEDVAEGFVPGQARAWSFRLGQSLSLRHGILSRG